MCGQDVIETAKAFGCSAWRDTGCAFKVWKVIAGKKLGATHVKDAPFQGSYAQAQKVSGHGPANPSRRRLKLNEANEAVLDFREEVARSSRTSSKQVRRPRRAAATARERCKVRRHTFMAQASHSASANGAARPFLTADWRHLVIVNYEVGPGVLTAYLPAGVELDTWEGKTLASIVAFEFSNTRVLGVGIPGHRDFHEVKLRFYVRRRVNGGWRRGVVFVEELVPRRAIAWTANLLYGERYRALRMNGEVWRAPCENGLPDWTTYVRYWWWLGRWHGGSYQAVYAECDGEPSLGCGRLAGGVRHGPRDGGIPQGAV